MGTPKPITTTLATVGGAERAQGGSSGPAARRPVFTQEMLQNREVMVRQLNEVTKLVHDATQAGRSSPLLSAVIQQVTVTAGQEINLAHGLGRPYQGYFPVRAQGASPLLYEVALSTGLTADRYVRLHFVNAGTFDILVY